MEEDDEKLCQLLIQQQTKQKDKNKNKKEKSFPTKFE